MSGSDECSNIQDWIGVAVAIVSTVWAITNEILAKRKGDKKEGYACVGDCVRGALSGTMKKNYVLPKSSDEKIQV